MNAPILITTLVTAWLFGMPFAPTHIGSTPMDPGPRITFIDTLVHDFGAIAFGGDGRCSFRFINTGDAPLVITSFKSSCGCLVPTFQREPVIPGDIGTVSLKYDTRRQGPINKSATLTSNATNTPELVLRIKGTVLADTASFPQPVSR